MTNEFVVKLFKEVESFDQLLEEFKLFLLDEKLFPETFYYIDSLDTHFQKLQYLEDEWDADRVDGGLEPEEVWEILGDDFDGYWDSAEQITGDADLEGVDLLISDLDSECSENLKILTFFDYYKRRYNEYLSRINKLHCDIMELFRGCFEPLG